MPGAGPQRKLEISREEGCWKAQFLAMGSPCELLCDDDDEVAARAAAQAVATESWRIEDKFSRYLRGNIIDRINRAGGARIDVDEETARLIDFAVTLYELSDRRFDITSGSLRRVWTFDGSANVPKKADVDAVLERVGWHKVEWHGSALRIPPGMEIDLGGIGKEYAVDRAAAMARDQTTASCLVNFGGDLAVSREPSTRDAWSVGIEALGGGAYAPDTIIRLSAGALATSGDAQRFLLKDGVRYSHILDPRTGWPVQGAPASITVAADTCVQAGMLSTLAMLQGEGAEAFLEAQGCQYWLGQARCA
jgi:thiamine biosynthesis lipoprotein